MMDTLLAAWAALPVLSLLIGMPLVAAGLLWWWPPQQARALAVAVAVVECLLACGVVAGVNPEQAGFQWVERAAWLPMVNGHYLLGVDGLSALFLPCSAVLFLCMVLSSGVQTWPRFYFALLLALEGITVGIFCALDTLLFFLFWELTLLPIYFLVSLWGIGPHRRFAATQYTLWMLAGGVLLLVGFLLAALGQAGLAAGSGGSFALSALVFDLPTLLATPLPIDRQWPIFFLLLLGFAVKTPVIPFHVWLPMLAMEGPVAVVAMMTGLKLGAYGIIRFALPLAPQVASKYSWLLAGLGVVGIYYGGLAALAQTNLRRLLAFSSISHVGLVLLAVASLTVQGVQGAILQLLNFTLVAGGLFLIAGFVRQRTDSTEWVHLGGMVRSMPFVTTFFLFLGLAGMGMPLTSGFPAEQLMLLGIMATHKGAALAALGGQILGAGYFLHYYCQAFLGPVTHRVVAEAADLRPREWLVLLLVSLPVLASGLYPRWIVHFTQAPAVAWLAHVAGAKP
ncbi:MAG: NADH-quinone oxidoreductase subunit M [Magnetococcales bacterium]|nr:NADH-quinone oxidoreductase subunit M [Magnetococcales bacterium]